MIDNTFSPHADAHHSLYIYTRGPMNDSVSQTSSVDRPIKIHERRKEKVKLVHERLIQTWPPAVEPI